ncbi:sarcosine oxidase subunit gamma [Pseudooceanicola sp. 216_PA32_1]|uniref:Sarcosine oxidase subunit gamma n=1 Tax=Pseudooceanicola pacificus TaxID=2676438 RepID=A0A844W3Y0_9RHOB|nr:sarcosine oxidase subunit gamma family protein [Pseudooceanicola pacificus]MWB78527.1 sarcosine oxidase subunit gamma [Pseudooceanicola pacificus]
MSEPVTALNGATYAGVARIAELPRRGMITIRGSQESAALVAAVGAASGGLDMPGPGEAVIAADRMLGWMSPDELLLMLPPAEVAGALAALAEGMAGEHYLAVEVTDARALFSISGEGAVAREVLARLAPVDLSPAAFGPGNFRRTRLAQVPAAFWMLEDGSFELMCFRSVAAYVFGLLCTAGEGDAVGHY